MTTISIVPSVVENAQKVIKINYAKSKDARVWREIYAYTFLADNQVKYSVVAYGRNSSFAVSTWDNEKEALAEFNQLMKEGK